MFTSPRIISGYRTHRGGERHRNRHLNRYRFLVQAIFIIEKAELWSLFQEGNALLRFLSIHPFPRVLPPTNGLIHFNTTQCLVSAPRTHGLGHRSTPARVGEERSAPIIHLREETNQWVVLPPELEFSTRSSKLLNFQKVSRLSLWVVRPFWKRTVHEQTKNPSGGCGPTQHSSP